MKYVVMVTWPNGDKNPQYFKGEVCVYDSFKDADVYKVQLRGNIKYANGRFPKMAGSEIRFIGRVPRSQLLRNKRIPGDWKRLLAPAGTKGFRISK